MVGRQDPQAFLISKEGLVSQYLVWMVIHKHTPTHAHTLTSEKGAHEDQGSNCTNV